MPRLDLDLWLNQDLIKRQNKLKSEFLYLLESIGNHFENEYLKSAHPLSKGKKISKGNDLLGFPYQVLDLIRDFSPESEVNIRCLNWFGHGFFLFLILGHDSTEVNERLIETGYSFSLSESPWDYPEMILEKRSTRKLAEIHSSGYSSNVWLKSIPMERDFLVNLNNVKLEIKKLVEILLSLQKTQKE